MKEKNPPLWKCKEESFQSLSLYFSDSSHQIHWEVPGSFSGAAFLTLLLANAGDLRISFQSNTSGSCLYILGSLNTADLYSTWGQLMVCYICIQLIFSLSTCAEILCLNYWHIMLRVHRLPMKKTTIPCFLGGNNVTQCKITYHLQSANSFSHQINESLFIDLIGCVDAFLFVGCSVWVRTFPCCLVEHKAKQ